MTNMPVARSPKNALESAGSNSQSCMGCRHRHKTVVRTRLSDRKRRNNSNNIRYQGKHPRMDSRQPCSSTRHAARYNTQNPHVAHLIRLDILWRGRQHEEALLALDDVVPHGSAPEIDMKVGVAALTAHQTVVLHLYNGATNRAHHSHVIITPPLSSRRHVLRVLASERVNVAHACTEASVSVPPRVRRSICMCV